MKLLASLCFFCVLAFNSLAQANVQLSMTDSSNLVDMYQEVLSKNQIGVVFTYGQWYSCGETQADLIYLGEIHSTHGVYKIMTSNFSWGLSRRATCRILVFNQGNRLLGNYYVEMSDLPEKIEGNELVFLHSTDLDCDQNLQTRISFKNGIPKRIFIECIANSGQVYTFDRDYPKFVLKE